MSKTTIFLLFILLVFVGFLLYILFGNYKNPIISSITKPLLSENTASNLSLSFSTATPTVHAGQTVSVAVDIHNPDPHPDLVQLEIGYDPMSVTIDSITPGTFFTNPTIALERIDPASGRISYALHCSTTETGLNTDCVNASSQTVATLTFSVNPYYPKATTTLSFFPKTVVRTKTGKDLLQHTDNLNVTIGSIYHVASSSGVASQSGSFYHVTPMVITPPVK